MTEEEYIEHYALREDFTNERFNQVSIAKYKKAIQLSIEILEMIEEKRFDSLYIMTTPDKPYGASDLVNEMFTADDVVKLLYAVSDKVFEHSGIRLEPEVRIW